MPDETVWDLRPIAALDDKATTETVDVARTQSFQDRATRDTEAAPGGPLYNVLSMLVSSGETISPWWSIQRDKDLRGFWKRSDHLSGAVYAMTSKIATIPFKVTPKDVSVTSQVRMAAEAQDRLLNTPEFGEGWQEFITKWLIDLLVTDNGGFAELIGSGPPDGPLLGYPISVAHLDSLRVSRTSNPEFPLIYQDEDGKRYKIHHTRCMFASQLPSPQVEMHSVGFCAVSRAINAAQNLMDIAQYKQEKIGSRPPRAIVLVKKGASAEEVLRAFYMANEQMDNAGLSRFAKLVCLAPTGGRGELDMELIDLASLPDGFEEETSVNLGMYAIALAFGVDARELWPSTTSGATKGDAMIQHLKARGKGTGQILALIERQINWKYLPPSLDFHFDFQDDEQDALRADISDKRSQRNERDLAVGSITVRVDRERMLEDGDITRPQFEQMELDDGRLEDGTNVLALFFSADREMKELLNIGLDNPFSYNGEVDGVLRRIDSAIGEAHKWLVEQGWSTKKQKARQAIAALEQLKRNWEERIEERGEDNLGERQGRNRPSGSQDGRNQPGPKPTQTAADAERRRNEDDYRGESEMEVIERIR